MDRLAREVNERRHPRTSATVDQLHPPPRLDGVVHSAGAIDLGRVADQGLTGSARLLQDVHRLDQYAFDTDRRKLHLTQTFPLSQIAAFELQRFRETGVLTFATPQKLFDRESPGTTCG